MVEGGGDVTPASNATKSPRGKKNFEEKKKFESVTPSVSTPQIVASFDEDLKVAPAFGSDGSNFDPEIFSRGSKKSSPEKKKRALLGVTCISEMSNDGTVLVWAENLLFYRLRSDDFTRVPKPLTPIFFETDGDLHSRKISKSSDIPTYVGTFQRFPDEKKESFSLSGVFIHDDRSVTFECNPGAAFARPIKSSFFKDQLHVTVLKSLKFNVRCEAKFATSGQSLLKNRSPSAFPSSVSGFAPPVKRPPVVDPVGGSFPPQVLVDLRAQAEFKIHIVVGLPENDIIPSLSYSDFLDLQDNGAVNWRTIEKKISEKYKAISLGGGGGGRWSRLPLISSSVWPSIATTWGGETRTSSLSRGCGKNFRFTLRTASPKIFWAPLVLGSGYLWPSPLIPSPLPKIARN